MCAPILRKKLSYWTTRAERVREEVTSGNRDSRARGADIRQHRRHQQQAQVTTNREGGNNRVSDDVFSGEAGRTTIKGGKGYEETWHSFDGSPSRRKQDMIEYFGLDSESVSGLTPYEVAVQCEQIAHGVGNVTRTLGGTPVAQNDSAEADTDAFAQAKAAQQRAAKEAQSESEAPNPLYKAIADAETVDALKLLWAENQAAFTDTDLMTAWKARGKELSK